MQLVNHMGLRQGVFPRIRAAFRQIDVNAPVQGACERHLNLRQ